MIAVAFGVSLGGRLGDMELSGRLLVARHAEGALARDVEAVIDDVIRRNIVVVVATLAVVGEEVRVLQAQVEPGVPSCKHRHARQWRVELVVSTTEQFRLENNQHTMHAILLLSSMKTTNSDSRLRSSLRDLWYTYTCQLGSWNSSQG